MLDLKELDRLEREDAVHRDPTRTETETLVFASLRPLLDLVEQMGEALEGIHPNCRGKQANDALAAWKREKGDCCSENPGANVGCCPDTVAKGEK